MPNNTLNDTFSDDISQRAIAFGDIYDAHYQPILRYCLRRIGDVEAAEDVTAETFMNALKAYDRYESRSNIPISAWLYKIATNQLRMYYLG